MSEPDLIFRIEGGVGRISLNRPQAIHALTHGMCQAMLAALVAWKADPAVRLVMIDHASGRGFCAGGDIRMLAESGYGDGREGAAFFHLEYQLNHLMFVYPKPIVAFVDGIVMGGGAGISLPCPFRVATERTTFAMPETAIGLFPDVGGSWHLTRLPKRAGWWLGLTGARIKAADSARLGLTTHTVAFDALDALKAAICENPAALESLLAAADTPPGPAPVDEHLAEIEQAFSTDSIEDVIAALEAGSPWAQEQATVVKTRSPQSMKVTWRLLAAAAAAADFADVMRLEYRVSSRIIRTHDFLQGVRAAIVVKDNDPRWYPPTLTDTPDAAIDRLLADLPPGQEWTPLKP